MPTRLRTRTQPTQTSSAQLNRYDTAGNGGPLGAPVVCTLSSHNETMSDIVTPGWTGKRGSIVVNNPCSYTKSTVEGGGGSFSTTNGTYTYTITGGSITQYMRTKYPPTGTQYATCSAEADMIAAAKAKALGNIDRAPFSIAEDIAEMRQMVTLLRDPLHSMHRLTDSLFNRRRNPITNTRVSRSASAAEVWATSRWGYKPLMDSIETIIQSFGYEDIVDASQSVILSSHGKVSDSGKITQPNLRHTYGANYDQFFHSHVIERKVNAYVLYRNYNPIRGWRYEYGLRARDVPELLWAIVPWSFMIDRVSNISTALRGLSAFSSPSIEIVGGGYVVKTDSFDLWKYVTQHEPPYVCTANGDETVSHDFTYNRVLWNPNVLDTFVVSDFHGLVKDTLSIVDLITAIRLIFR